MPGLDKIERESFHSMKSVEDEIVNTNLDLLEVDSRDSWESRCSRDSIEMYNERERRDIKWTRHSTRATIDDAHPVKPGDTVQEEEEDPEIRRYCKLLQVTIRQSWPLFISGSHLKLKTAEGGKFMVVAKLLGSKGKVLLDEDVTHPQALEGKKVKFSDPLLVEVPSSSTILLLQVKNIITKSWMAGFKSVNMRTLGCVYIKVKDILQEDNHRIHDFFPVQKGVPATMFCNVTLMSPYMKYITLLQLGSQNEKHDFGNDKNHFRKIQNEEAKEVFTFGRVKYSRKKGLLKRSGVSDSNISDMKACLEEMNFPWLEAHGDRSMDVIFVKMDNRKLEIKEIVALIFKYINEEDKVCYQIVRREFSFSEEIIDVLDGKSELDGEKTVMKPKLSWTRFARIRLNSFGKLRNTLKKCRLESNASFDFINESNLDMGLELKHPDVWKVKDVNAIPHIVGSWMLYEKGVSVEKLTHLDDRSEKLKKTEERKKIVFARAEVYVHYLESKRSFFGCYRDQQNQDQYVYRGFKLMIQKNFVKHVPSIVALVIALKECELQGCL